MDLAFLQFRMRTRHDIQLTARTGFGPTYTEPGLPAASGHSCRGQSGSGNPRHPAGLLR
jgi:hypothetical protein